MTSKLVRCAVFPAASDKFWAGFCDGPADGEPDSPSGLREVAGVGAADVAAVGVGLGGAELAGEEPVLSFGVVTGNDDVDGSAWPGVSLGGAAGVSPLED
ncbi:hypothetical protein AAEX63_07320 [Luteococcus sp. H138]|uniref:hypothetical protein n=1 Tax=unclassified Luteococcus TaxID=2639923 RepID=UPI00313D4BCC